MEREQYQAQYLSATGSGPARVLLDGVPRAGVYLGGDGCPEDTPFASCLRACLQFLGEDYGWRYVLVDRITRKLDNLYTFIMGTSGAAFSFSWETGLQPSPQAILPRTTEPVCRAFEAAGYDYEIVRGERDRDNEAYFRTRIIESIRDKGRPVLAYGVVGPPEMCIVTGYDDYADVLTGWSYFQHSPDYNRDIEFEPSGYFRKRDWFANTRALIVIGERHARPDPDEVLRQALRTALDEIRGPLPGKSPGECQAIPEGLAAYRAWADALMRDANFPAGDVEAFRVKLRTHRGIAAMLANRRWHAAQFLKQVAAQEPGALWAGVPYGPGRLHEAASCYQTERDLLLEVWTLAGAASHLDARSQRRAGPSLRGKIAGLVLQAREMECQAAFHIEQALAMRSVAMEPEALHQTGYKTVLATLD